MDAALHDGDGDSSDGAKDEVAGVSLDSGCGEVGDLSVGNARGVVDVLGEVAKAGAKDDADGWGDVRRGANVVGSGLGVGVEVAHLFLGVNTV